MNDFAREAPIEPLVVPASLTSAVKGMSWAHNSIGQAGAAVYRLHAPGRSTLYLKSGRGSVAQALADEMVRMQWLGHYITVPSLHGFVANQDEAWLLMSEVPGKTAYELVQENPHKRFEIVTMIARYISKLHALPVEACPFNGAHSLQLARARRRIELGEVDESDFDDERAGWTAEQVWAEMMSLLPIETDPVVSHGDFSLNNIMLEQGRVTGLIDTGRVGIADRYQDLALLWNSLSEFEQDLQMHVFDAYGISDPDKKKLRFHLALDEFF